MRSRVDLYIKLQEISHDRRKIKQRLRKLNKELDELERQDWLLAEEYQKLAQIYESNQASV